MKMELLAPAGGPETLRTAVRYGADAVYLGAGDYGLRAKAKKFTEQELKDGIRYAHENGVKVYVTVNIIAHNRHLDGLPEYLLSLRDAGADALIIADAGVLSVAKRTVPELELHLSTQASATNYETFNFWAEQGVKRIVAAREVTLEELAEIRAALPENVEIEAFVHGAMCVSVSGRCLLSNYLSARSSNLGECTQPCRWRYALTEEKRPGEYFPVFEEEGYTFILNSKDLCMIEHLPELQKAGVGSLKIEGRMKNPLYIAAVTKIYREALDDLAESEEKYRGKLASYKERLGRVSHRGYTTGFFFGDCEAEMQNYSDSAYQRGMDFAAVSIAPEAAKDGCAFLEQRGKFSVGETLYYLNPTGSDGEVPVTSILTEAGESRDSAPHAQEHLWLALPEGIRAPEAGTVWYRLTEPDNRQ